MTAEQAIGPADIQRIVFRAEGTTSAKAWRWEVRPDLFEARKPRGWSRGREQREEQEPLSKMGVLRGVGTAFAQSGVGALKGLPLRTDIIFNTITLAAVWRADYGGQQRKHGGRRNREALP